MLFVNSANKTWLQKYLFEFLQNLAVLHQKKSVYSLKERTLTIEKKNFCHQHEVDTKIFYHTKILDSRNDTSTVVTDAEDTEVFVISVYASHKLEKEVVLYRRNNFILLRWHQY